MTPATYAINTSDEFDYQLMVVSGEVRYCNGQWQFGTDGVTWRIDVAPESLHEGSATATVGRSQTTPDGKFCEIEDQ